MGDTPDTTAADRLRFLAEIGPRLATPRDWREMLRDVFELAVPRFADWCVVDLVEDDGTPYRLAVIAPPAQRALADDLAAQPLDTDQLGYEVGCGAAGVLFAEVPDVLPTLPPRQHELSRALGMRSMVLVPLRARARGLGVVTFVYGASGRRYDPSDVAFLEIVTHRAAFALANTRLRARERATRHLAESARNEVETLFALTDRVNRATRLEDVYEPALDAIAQLCRVERTAILLFDGDDAMHFKAWRGLSDAYRAAVDGHSPWPRYGRDIRPIAIADARAEPALAALAPAIEAERIRALAFVPLLRGDELLGKFMLYDGEPRQFSAHELQLAELAADQVAQAVVRAHLFAAERAARDEAMRAIGLRDEFLSVAGHELKTPLTSLLLLAQAILRAGPHDERLGARVEKLTRHATRLGALIDELLDVSRVSAGQLRLEREDVDLTEVVVEHVGRLADEIHRAGSQVRIDPGGELHGQWDRARVEQVVSNLLSNALKYGRGRPIDVTTARAGDRAVVVVRDRGIGIAAEDQARIFMRFERAVSPRHFGGLGLGLWIVRQIVEAHGGSIAVASVPGEGAEFRVELPLSARVRS